MEIETETKTELVTLERSQDLLDSSPGNRKITQSQVDQYVRLMQDGEFKPHIGCISLDEEGRLIDGHHTLLAILAFGKPVRVRVQYGVPREDAKLFGLVLPVRGRDALYVMDHDYDGIDLIVANAIAILVQYQMGVVFKNKRHALSGNYKVMPHEVAEFARLYPELKDIARGAKLYKRATALTVLGFVFPDAPMEECAKLVAESTRNASREIFADLYPKLSVTYEPRRL